MVQNAVFQSNCSILQSVISQEGNEWWDWFLAYRSTSFLQVATSILGVHDQVCWKYPKQKVWISLQYLHRNLGNEIHFLPADKHNLIVCVTTNAQITQNNKFAISLHYLKKKVSDEVDILHADEQESFLQMDTMIFDGDDQAFPRLLK